jgi:hypothetical protein
VAALTRYAIIRLANGNQQRVTILADNQINAPLIIEAQYGIGSIISGPHRLMRAIWPLVTSASTKRHNDLGHHPDIRCSDGDRCLADLAGHFYFIRSNSRCGWKSPPPCAS